MGSSASDNSYIWLRSSWEVGGHFYLTCIYLAWLEAAQGMFSSKIAEVQGPGRTPQTHLQLLKTLQPPIIHLAKQVLELTPKQRNKKVYCTRGGAEAIQKRRTAGHRAIL